MSFKHIPAIIIIHSLKNSFHSQFWHGRSEYAHLLYLTILLFYASVWRLTFTGGRLATFVHIGCLKQMAKSAYKLREKPIKGSSSLGEVTTSKKVSSAFCLKLTLFYILAITNITLY